MQTVAALSETELIARIQRLLPPKPDWLVVGIGDDAAIVAPARNRLEVLTVDAIVDGVHFDRAFTPADAIGHRALAVNLSDIAAMGAEPRLALLSMAVPADLPCADFDAMTGALAALAARHKVTLAGGNLTRTHGPLMLDVTVIGTVKSRQSLTRSGARPGDDLYVTGTIGAAAAGLGMLRDTKDTKDTKACVDRYLYPEARVRMGLLLGRNRAAAACVDLSDGLADAVARLAEASAVGAIVEADALPIEPSARDWFAERGTDAVLASITGGDDYELLCAVRPAQRGRLKAAARHGDAALTRVGVCTRDRALILKHAGRESPMPRGYTHFR